MKTPIPLPIAELKSALTGLSKIIPKRASLPIVSAIKIERTSTGWITLTGCDLDQFATVRLEQPTPGEAAVVLIPLDELLKVSALLNVFGALSQYRIAIHDYRINHVANVKR